MRHRKVSHLDTEAFVSRDESISQNASQQAAGFIFLLWPGFNCHVSHVSMIHLWSTVDAREKCHPRIPCHLSMDTRVSLHLQEADELFSHQLESGYKEKGEKNNTAGRCGEEKRKNNATCSQYPS